VLAAPGLATTAANWQQSASWQSPAANRRAASAIRPYENEQLVILFANITH